jgi:recombination protein RecA
VDLAEETGIIVRKGAWYSYNGDNISQGRDNAIKYLEEKPEFAEQIKQQVREKLDKGAVVSANSVTKASEEDEEIDLEEEE